MKSRIPTHRAVTVSIAIVACLAGCGRRDHADHSAHDHDGETHAHNAPHGGILVEAGDHQANLEVVLDRATGVLSIYVLDAHAENFVRISAPDLDASVRVGSGEPETLQLAGVADPATGETVGDTSHFRAQAELLKSTEPVEVVVRELSLPAGRFSDLRATLL